MEKIDFSIEKHNEFIDFLKGVCIVNVILTHTISKQLHQYSLFCYWGDMAVPIFLLLQVYHSYKRGVENCKLNTRKVIKRIVVPFLVAQVLALLILVLWNKNFSLMSLMTVFKEFGNLGPGAYYPYIYCGFVVILYILSFIIKRHSQTKIFLFLLILSVLSEITCCLFDCRGEIYRFLPVRYLFIVYFGYVLSQRKSIDINGKIVLFSIVSISFITLFNYTNIDFSPLFYSKSWRVFHWVSYFYVSSLLIWLFFCIYKLLHPVVKSFFCDAGKLSYEIFLFQMIYFIISPVHLVFDRLNNGLYISVAISIIDVIICTFSIFLYNHLRKKVRL